MQERKLRVAMEYGIHLRVAAEIAKVAEAFDAAITLGHRGHTADAKSIIHILMLGATKGSDLLMQARGTDESAAVEALDAVFSCLARNEYGSLARVAKNGALLHADSPSAA